MRERFQITRIVPSPNCHSDPITRFQIDPQIQISTMRSLRYEAENRFSINDEPRESIIGHYHSHPKGTAKPSVWDLEQVNDPTLLWMILALNGQSPLSLSAWLPDKVKDRLSFRKIALRYAH
jgi:proteasome lid subunit RPN8/RPN11